MLRYNCIVTRTSIAFQHTLHVHTTMYDVYAQVVSIWHAMGSIDTRYNDSDDFIVTLETLIALFIGPACLVYAWAVYSRKSYRHIVGISLTSVQVFTQLLYFAMEVRSGFDHTIHQGKATFLFGFVFITLLRILLPATVLFYNLKHIYSRVRAAEIKYTKLLGEHQQLKAGLRHPNSSRSVTGNRGNRYWTSNNNRGDQRQQLQHSSANTPIVNNGSATARMMLQRHSSNSIDANSNGITTTATNGAISTSSLAFETKDSVV
jgi:EXPERA (EXPanded EBP superfamily)